MSAPDGIGEGYPAGRQAAGRPSGPVLFCVDGSPVALRALQQACTLLAPGPAVALCVWLPAVVLHPGTLDALAELASPAADVDAASARAAGAIAEAASAQAGAAGFACTARAARGTDTGWREILSQADSLDAATIVMGSRRHSAMSERVLGGTAHRVLSHAHRPVLTVSPGIDSGSDPAPGRSRPPGS